MRIAFCCNAGQGIGGGHAYRCLALADMLASYDCSCVFLVTPETVKTVTGLSRHSIILMSRRYDRDEIEVLCDEAEKSMYGDKMSWLVCDSYELDAKFEVAARHWTDNILVLDDMADRPHECDVLVNAGPGRQKADFRELTSKATEILTGPEYAILRPEFPCARDVSLKRRKRESSIKRVFVNFGALDGKNMSPIVLQALANIDHEISVDVVLGRGAKNRNEVCSIAAQADLDVTVHVDPENIELILTSADIALGAAGSSIWERSCLGVPSVLITTAEDQKYTANQLCSSGAAVYAGDWETISVEQVSKSWLEATSEIQKISEMSELSSSLCDGLGLNRIRDRMLGTVADGQTE